MTLSAISPNLPLDTLLDAGIVQVGSARIGVTRGAPKFVTNRTWENIVFDGKFAPLKGLDRPMHGEPSLSFTMLELGGAATGNQIPRLEPGVTPATTNAPAAPGTVTATPSATGGTLAAATYYYKATAIGLGGESLGSTEASAIVTGTTGSVALSVAAVTGATSYRFYRGTAAGAENVYFASATPTFTDIGGAGTAGTVNVAVNSTIVHTPASSGALIAAGSYQQDFRVVWERAGGGYAAAYFPWALCLKYDIAGQNKGEALIACEFVGRVDYTVGVVSDPAYRIELRTALP